MTSSSDSNARFHVAVTGAGGLIGSALGRRLEAAGHTVTPLVRRPAGPGEISWDPENGRLEPGMRGTFTADLTAGDYGLICFVPDAKDGKMHLVHGMMKNIKVS